jgi:hypothetical protein
MKDKITYIGGVGIHKLAVWMNEINGKMAMGKLMMTPTIN